MGLINIYCDESCHLENDHQKSMVLGAVWCDAAKAKDIAQRIRDYKNRYGYHGEFKWTKVSPSNLQFYLDLVDFFFDDADLHYRGLIVPQKSLLDHKRYGQTHDDFYYKMYYDMLKIIFEKSNSYRVLLDIKDTNSADKNRSLHKFLCNKLLDFDAKIVVDVQAIRSHLINIVQITDVLTGALSYFYRELNSSKAKEILIKRIKHRSGLTLTKNTFYTDRKFNLLIWNSGKEESL